MEVPEVEPLLAMTLLKAEAEVVAVEAASDMRAGALVAGCGLSCLCFGGGSFMVKSGSPREMDVVGMAECEVIPPGVLMPGVWSPGR